MSASALSTMRRRQWSGDEDGWSYDWGEHVNVAAIVVPIVVGLAVIAAITFLFIKARRRRQRKSERELPHHSSAPYSNIPVQDVVYRPYQGYQPPASNDLTAPPQVHAGDEGLPPPSYQESAKDGPGIKG